MIKHPVSNLRRLEIIMSNDYLMVQDIADLMRVGRSTAIKQKAKIYEYCRKKVIELEDQIKTAQKLGKDTTEAEKKRQYYNIGHLQYLPTKIVLEVLGIDQKEIERNARTEKQILGYTTKKESLESLAAKGIQDDLAV